MADRFTETDAKSFLTFQEDTDRKEQYKREMVGTVLRFANVNWKENEHPRAADGKFGQGGGESKSSSGETPASQMPITGRQTQPAFQPGGFWSQVGKHPANKPAASKDVRDDEGDSTSVKSDLEAFNQAMKRKPASPRPQVAEDKPKAAPAASEPVHSHPAIQAIEKHYPPANPEGADTLERHKTAAGGFTPERQELHKGIIDGIRRNVPKSAKKTYFMLGGGPAPLALDTLIPTIDGWTTMGEIKVGDQIFDGDGNLTEVVMASPVFHNRQCFRLTLEDGTEVIADSGHRWVTSTRASRKSANRRMDRGYAPDIRRRARDMREHGLTYQEIEKEIGVSGAIVCQWEKRPTPGGRNEDDIRTTLEIKDTLCRGDGSPNHAIENHNGIKSDGIAVYIPPYTLGAWLGDGTSSCAVITAAETEIIKRIEADGFTTRKRETKRTPAYLIRGLSKGLRLLGLIGNKHIPAQYLRGSINQRVQLLQGLMDTDGYCNKIGACEFTTTSKPLADGFFELLSSLGIKSRVTEGIAKLYGREIGPKWRIHFSANFSVFTIERKRSRQRLIGSKPRRRLVVAVQPCESVPVRCLTVKSLASTFLITKAMVCTHNSGKSSILKSGQVSLPEAVHLDSDAIKGSLPEYAALVKEKDTRAAFYAHEESSHIAKAAQKESFAAGQDVLLDGTGDSSLDAVRSKCAAARQAGYAVNAEYVTCSVDEAVRRNLERAKKTGRLPPEKMLRDVHKSVSAILPKAVEEGLFDNVRLWDTEHPDASGNPTLVMSAAGNKLTVHHPELWDKFQAKAKG